MSTSPLPESLGRLSQDHIDLRLALTVFEAEVDAVAQYHPPDPVRLGAATQYFGSFPARAHHPIEEMIYATLQARAPDAAERATSVMQHERLDKGIGELALITRNLFLETQKWRVPYCSTARSFLVLKREHIRDEERNLFPLALEHLTAEDWGKIDAAAREAHARWVDDPGTARIAQVLGLRSAG